MSPPNGNCARAASCAAPPGVAVIWTLPGLCCTFDPTVPVAAAAVGAAATATAAAPAATSGTIRFMLMRIVIPSFVYVFVVGDVFQDRLRPHQSRPRWHPSLTTRYLQRSVAASRHGRKQGPLTAGLNRVQMCSCVGT